MNWAEMQYIYFCFLRCRVAFLLFLFFVSGLTSFENYFIILSLSAASREILFNAEI